MERDSLFEPDQINKFDSARIVPTGSLAGLAFCTDDVPVKCLCYGSRKSNITPACNNGNLEREPPPALRADPAMYAASQKSHGKSNRANYNIVAVWPARHSG